MTNNIYQYLLISISVLLLSSFLFPLSSFGASQQFIVSWQADSYAPSWYQGKIFPTRGSLINVSFEIVNNNKIVDVSKNKIRWYINDKLIKNENNGLGIKSLKFINDGSPGGEISVKIAVVDYATEPLYKIIRIPVVAPEAVIDAPYAERKINTEKNLFHIIPFFFNIKNINTLSFEWQVNEQSANSSESPRELNLNIDSQTPPGAAIDIAATIKNIANQFEFASKNIKFEIK